MTTFCRNIYCIESTPTRKVFFHKSSKFHVFIALTKRNLIKTGEFFNKIIYKHKQTHNNYNDKINTQRKKGQVQLHKLFNYFVQNIKQKEKIQ